MRDVRSSPWARRVTLRRAQGATALLVTALLVGGCAERYSEGRIHHDDSGKGGPLSAKSGEGGFGAAPSKKTPWYMSYGSFMLCARAPGATITLRKVDYEAGVVAPLEVRPYLRTVRKDQVVLNDEGWFTDETNVFISAEGRPPALDGYKKPLVGTFTNKIDGHRVTQPCSELRDPENGYTELIFVMKFGKEGGYVPRASIEYTAGGDTYVLEMKWAMGACGTKLPMPEVEETKDLC
ncbi:hypothetical protein [Streptomyces sp. CC219B]|uniref:hypothetical protein n=1 Tax=Streptomyces sp. CC219B TaxID=3044574 RepID=UPI0024A951C1|nr:hypothetical protein [Streptomyces sp. CC219B]